MGEGEERDGRANISPRTYGVLCYTNARVAGKMCFVGIAGRAPPLPSIAYTNTVAIHATKKKLARIRLIMCAPFPRPSSPLQHCEGKRDMTPRRAGGRHFLAEVTVSCFFFEGGL